MSRAYEVRDEAGHVGLFLADHFARPDKRSGALDEQLPRPGAHGRAGRPDHHQQQQLRPRHPDPAVPSTTPSTLFHEFGHALHGLLSRVRYPSQSGTSVRRDFVEFPSQVYEHWLELPETLRAYAPPPRNRRSPARRSDRPPAGRPHLQPGFFSTVEFLASAILDMELHLHPDPATLDIEAFETEVLAGLSMPAEITARHRPAHFQHLFSGGGYAAGYYSYLWAEVLDADGFDAFTEAGDPFHPEVAARLKTILQSGDTRDPMALYVAFRGRPPETAALLRMRGLT
jgi:peptidyl-dipeptidase Dcp